MTQGYLKNLQEESFGPHLSKASLRLLKKRCPICLRRTTGRAGHEACLPVLERFLACKHGRLTDPELRAMILRRDGYRCRYCGCEVDFNSAHIDHLIPWSKGGRTVPQNLLSACRRCNLRKRDIVPPKRDLEWMIVLGRPLRDRAAAAGYRTA